MKCVSTEVLVHHTSGAVDGPTGQGPGWGEGNHIPFSVVRDNRSGCVP